jgi:hypothetical protein
MSDVYVVSVTEVCLVSVYDLSMENCRVIPRKKNEFNICYYQFDISDSLR